MAEVIFDTLSVGDEIPSLVIGPISTAHIVRWSAAMENWHRIHYDQRYAKEHDQLPDVLVNGSWRQHLLIRLVTDWAGEEGWLWKISLQFRGMNLPGDILTAWGKVTELEKQGQFGIAKLDVGLKNQKGEEGTPGKATVVLQLNGGPTVPYPFNPAILSISAQK